MVVCLSQRDNRVEGAYVCHDNPRPPTSVTHRTSDYTLHYKLLLAYKTPADLAGPSRNWCTALWKEPPGGQRLEWPQLQRNAHLLRPAHHYKLHFKEIVHSAELRLSFIKYLFARSHPTFLPCTARFWMGSKKAEPIETLS